MSFTAASCIMFTVNPTLALIALVMVPLLIALVTYCNIAMNKAWHQMYGRIADVNARVEDAVSGVRVVQSFTNEDFEINRFKEDNNLFRKAKLKAYNVMAGTHSSIYMMTRMLTLVILVVGAWLSFNGKLSYGELVSFVLYTNVLIKPIDKISAILELYPKGMAGFRRFRSLLDVDPDVKDAPNAVEVDTLTGNIRFNEVDFSYDR